MSQHTFVLFIGASLVLNLIPGPDMLFLLGRCVAQGKKAGLYAAFGINLGAYVHLAAAVTGLSAVLYTSASAFTALKWLGAVYLSYLGVRALLSRARAVRLDDGASQASGRSIFWQGFLSDVLNPKVAIFFLAFLPQFVRADSPHPSLQLLALGVTGNLLGIAVSLAIVWASSSLSARLRRNPTVSGWLHKAMGAMFVGLGIDLVMQRR